MDTTKTSSKPDIIVRDAVPVDTIDFTSKNKFKWEWLTVADKFGDSLSKYIRKISKDGVAWCCYCKSEIKYANGGRRCLLDHANKTKTHEKNRIFTNTNQQLPLAFQCLKEKVSGSSSMSVPTASTTTSIECSKVPYGAPQNVAESLGSNVSTESSDMPSVPIAASMCDRVTHAESFVCSFMAEHNIALSMAPHLVQFAQALSSDSKALEKLNMERQTATYKIRYGLAELEHVRLVNEMRTKAFSLNIDESTSKASKKRV